MNGVIPSPLPFGPIQRPVNSGDDPLEKSFISSFANSFNGKLNLLLCLCLGDVVPSNLDTRFQESFRQISHLNA